MLNSKKFLIHCLMSHLLLVPEGNTAMAALLVSRQTGAANVMREGMLVVQPCT
jgi:hypothetical protein